MQYLNRPLARPLARSLPVRPYWREAAPASVRARPSARPNPPRGRPLLELLEERLVLNAVLDEASFSFEVSGGQLFFTVVGTSFADTLVFWSDSSQYSFSMRYDLGRGEELLSGTVLAGDIATAELFTGMAFAGFRLVGGGGDDVIDASGATTPAFLEGGAGDDLLTGGRGPDTLDGGIGKDILRGGDGPDRLLGGDDDDLLIGDNFDILFSGGAGTDRFVADEVSTTGGISLTHNDIEIIFGSRFNDRIDSTDYAGSAPGVEVDGGAGDDTILGSAGPDKLDGGEGSDTLSFERSLAAVFVDLSYGRGEGDLFASLENLTGSPYDDVLLGDSGANVLKGMGGDDHLEGGFGNDRVNGGPGADTLGGGFGDDVLVLDAASLNDVDVFGGAGQDRFEFINARTTTGDLDMQRVNAAMLYLRQLRAQGQSDYHPSEPISFPLTSSFTPVFTSDGLTLSASTVAEGQSVLLRGTFENGDPNQQHVVWVEWGDGSPPTQIVLAPGVSTFTIEHVYRDDNPGGTSFDQVVIRATLSDEDGNGDTAQAGVRIQNVSPTLGPLGLSATVIPEGGQVVLSGTFTDPGLADTHRVVIDWGDGSAPTVLQLAPGARSFTATHVYGDDAPAGTAQDAFSIRVTMIDDDTGQGTAATSVTVVNVAPTLQGLSATVVNEGETTVLTGQVRDATPSDGLRLRINWGDGSAEQWIVLSPGATSFTVSHRYQQNNPPGGFLVTVTATDDDGGATQQQLRATVRNVPPQVQIDTNPTATGLVGEEVIVQAVVTPGSPLDSYEYEWTATPVASQATPTALSGSGTTFRFTPPVAGTYRVSLIVTDDEGIRTTVSILISVTALPTGPGSPNGGGSNPGTLPGTIPPGDVPVPGPGSGDPSKPTGVPRGSSAPGDTPSQDSESALLPSATGGSVDGDGRSGPGGPGEKGSSLPSLAALVGGGGEYLEEDDEQAELSGVVFDDVNGDGVQQPTESGLADRIVILEEGSDGPFRPVQQTRTDSSGRFTFPALRRGVYRVRVQLEKGEMATGAPACIDLRGTGAKPEIPLGIQGIEPEQPDGDEGEPAEGAALGAFLLLGLRPIERKRKQGPTPLR